MAFETLAVRTGSALVLAPAFLYVLHAGGTSLAVVLTVLALFCVHEFCSIARAAAHSPDESQAMLATIAIFYLGYLYGFAGAALAMTLFPLFLLLPYLTAAEHSHAIVDSSLTVFGVFHYSYFFCFLYLIRADSLLAFPALLSLIVMVWVQDSAAYFIGSAFGRRPLTSISPKKTWEGTGGGFLLAVLAGALTLQYGFGHPVGILTVALLGVVGVLAQLGDLSESLLKRNFGVKDSGSTIPGHGGLLDRFDSLCYSAPAMYVLFPWM